MKSHKFIKYFQAVANFSGSIKHDIQPPKDAKEIFMGGGHIGSDVVKMGVFGTIDELFDQRAYPRNQDTSAKRVRKYYAYYDSGKDEPIGFSKIPTINLHDADRSSLTNKTKLSAVTSGYRTGTLYRCGASNASGQSRFMLTHQIVFYYRL